LKLGMTARNVFQPELQIELTKEKLQRTYTTGLAWTDISLSAQTKIAFMFDIEKSSDRPTKILAGSEMTFNSLYHIRAGYNRDNLTLGVGLRYGRLNFDYAFKKVEYADDLHTVSFSMLVGKSIPEQIRLRELALLPPEPTEEEKQFQAYMKQANHFQQRFMLDSALQYYQLALDLDPDNSEIIGALAAIEEARRHQSEQEALLEKAKRELDQTIDLFLQQAFDLFEKRSYQASLDLLQLIFDIDQGNRNARNLRDRIYTVRQDEIETSLAIAINAETRQLFVDAIEAYNRVLEIDLENEEAKISKQRVLDAMGLAEKIRVAVELFDKGNHKSARIQFQAILRVNPNEVTALDYLRKINEAEKTTATLEDIQEDQDIWTLYIDGLRYMRNNEYQKAIENWQKVLKKYPNNSNTLRNIEQAQLKLESQKN